MGLWFEFEFFNMKTKEVIVEEYYAIHLSTAWNDAVNKATGKAMELFEQDKYWCLKTIKDVTFRG